VPLAPADTPHAVHDTTSRSGPDTDPGSIADGTVIARCVREELARYFEVLDGEPPSDLYRAVMRQAEAALLRSVLDQCRGNQSRAAGWLGISRGTLRGKLTDLGIR